MLYNLNINLNDYDFDSIDNIEHNNNFTVDIEVNHNHHYILDNGIISHNTLSILADNCTSGIEPLYKLRYRRKSRINKTIETFHYPLLKHIGEKVLEMTEDEIKKTYHYKETNEIDYKDRINLQSKIQEYTDVSISSTVNLPNSITVEDIYNIYLYAHEKKLKGITIFRDGCREGILSSIDDIDSIKENTILSKSQLDNLKKSASKLYLINKAQNRTIRRGFKVTGTWKGNKLYITLFHNNNNDITEVFVTLPKSSCKNQKGEYDTGMYLERSSTWELISRFISDSLTRGMTIDECLEQLEKSTSSLGDLSAVLCRAISNFRDSTPEDTKIKIKKEELKGEYCYSCKKYTIIREGGCNKCLSCGDSKCN